MKLSQKQVLEFRKLYKAKFGVELSNDEAILEATKLITIVRAVEVCKL